MTDDDTDALELVRLLTQRKQTLAVAESLTGGLLAAAVTAAPGASEVFVAGIVAYTPRMKNALVDVPAELIESAGVVSAAVAEALAAGVRERCGADWGMGTTGVAGPESHGGEPPGVVWLGFAGPDGRVSSRRLRLDGERASIRRQTVETALRLMASAVTGDAH